ncbi:MAG: NAD(P)/FAD-dependent oxidoreductase [Hydrogenophaga sp.]|uniref:NAD(P)/FAD-dependent oxidoreductase n=1 Tax=Hydrogenophaga sp. TaxID=1904254 RepID=UPI00271A0F7F|nr:NAD(P)/FAD-dependent oxidoreductase [Hydrogenophaga sp.]MDO9147614.1 NAD(P)/FAD-dependent oxidoreductase [Hydrogenophaga sp.]MDO9605667.1 NAD(P)/FAD-dependent oxidoreductase [Hydrogenophaga sp.]MDP2163640.1 NAD(P)/FAD-dependent oxidoreductase [Hydrogenophaga sp.]MDP3476014.1 NAD(P)/FAD-dependent oxidoreductase [Hydrogenophaga sp.]
MENFDVVIVGAGAAGLFCAGVAGKRGLKVLVLDHSDKVAEKIRISGGGRANFTNRDLDPHAPHKHFISQNPNFCRSALSRYTPADFVALMQRHQVPFHEKHKGQLFCDRSADDLIQMLLRECEAGSVQRWQPCGVKALRVAGDGSYQIDTERGTVTSRSVVIATGGLSIPKIGATDFGYRVATQFGLRLVETRPGLVPLTFDGEAWAPYIPLAGLSLPVAMETGTKKDRASFTEDLLFTHRGLSGPAVLQISSYWREGTPIRLNLAPEVDLPAALARAKATSRKLIANELATLVPSRLADAWVAQDADWQRPVCDATDKALTRLTERLARWELTPTGTEGYKKAEVTLGGVDTRDLSSQTMESKQPGLYFIGEVMDVTGWLGGYNFQWAWASAHACGQALLKSRS